MKKLFYYPLIILLTLILIIVLSSGISKMTGSPGGKTGSPGDANSTCTYCHSGNTANSIEGIISSNIPDTGYSPGIVYEISLSVSDENAIVYGFEMTAEDEQNKKQGVFSTGQSVNTKVTDNYITHNGVIDNDSNTINITFNWTAPAQAAGPITFYAAINAANNDGMATGDQIFITSHTVEGPPAITKIRNNTINNSIEIYPNPASDYVYIRNNNLSEKTISIFNLQGVLIMSFIAKGYENIINVTDLPEGLYLISIKEKDIDICRILMIN